MSYKENNPYTYTNGDHADQTYHFFNTQKCLQFEDVFINGDLKSQVTSFMNCLGEKLKF